MGDTLGAPTETFAYKALENSGAVAPETVLSTGTTQSKRSISPVKPIVTEEIRRGDSDGLLRSATRDEKPMLGEDSDEEHGKHTLDNGESSSAPASQGILDQAESGSEHEHESQSTSTSQGIRDQTSLEYALLMYRNRYLKTRTWIVDWVELDWEDFTNSHELDKACHIIEVFKTGLGTVSAIDADLRRRSESPLREFPKALGSGGPGSSWIQRIRLQSPAVISYLVDTGEMGITPDVGDTCTFIRPFAALVLLQPKIRLALEALEKKWENSEASATTTSHNSEVDKGIQSGVIESIEIPLEASSEQINPHRGMDDRTALDHLRCYVKFVDKMVMPLFDYFRDVRHKTVRFNDLPLLFPPGELIHWPSAGSIMSVPYPYYHSTWKVFHSKRRTYSDEKPTDVLFRKEDWFRVCCYYIDHDGSSYGVMKGRINFASFHGEKAITDLPAYPYRFMENAGKRLTELKEQGTRFRNLVKEHYLNCNGWTIPTEQQKRTESSNARVTDPDQTLERFSKMHSLSEHVEGHVIVDFDEAFKRHPNWKPEFRIPNKSRFRSGWHNDPYELTIWEDGAMNDNLLGLREYILLFDPAYDQWKNEFLMKDIAIDLSRTNSLMDIEEDDVALLPRRLIAYALRDRKFVGLDITSLRSVIQQDDLFKDLKIAQSHQRMVDSLVRAHTARVRLQKERPMLSLNQDIIEGKGAGLFILLHGVPGVGKTATAEAIAQRYNKPLFSITCGNLGYTPGEVEDHLKEIFRLAHRWGCILLLDEADVFLSRRDIHSLKRNALVSVFLHVLEYYSGILFLTTNRVGAIDEAFKSRLHLSLYYERLKEKQMMAIFKVNLRKLKGIEAQRGTALDDTDLQEADLFIDEEKIIEFAQRHWEETPPHARWNGRQIRNAFLIASSIARYDTGKKTLANQKSRKKGEVEGPVLDDRHFELVAETMRRFDTYFEMTTGETDERAAQLENIRNDSLREKNLVEYAQRYETPRSKNKSFRDMRVSEEESDWRQRRKEPRKEKSRNYDQEDRESKAAKAKKGKLTKSRSLAYEDKPTASSSYQRTRSPQTRPQRAGKPEKSSAKTSEASRSYKKRRDGSDEEESNSDEFDDSEGRRAQASQSERESANQSRGDRSDEEDYDDDE